MSSWASEQPRRQTRSIWYRPVRLERRTTTGVKRSEESEKPDTATPLSTVEAPRFFMCSGSEVSARPSPIICAKTVSVIGSTAAGSLSRSAHAGSDVRDSKGCRCDTPLANADAPLW